MSNKKRHVFISHTAELSQWPKGRSFVDAVKDAIRKAGCSCSEMHDWTADTQPPKNVIEQRLGECDVYLGLIGARYGSPLQEDPTQSYTQFEFRFARERRQIETLVFLLDFENPKFVSPQFVIQQTKFAKRQKKFREEVLQSGVTVARFLTADTLELLVYQALMQQAPPDPVGAFEETLKRLAEIEWDRWQSALRDDPHDRLDRYIDPHYSLLLPGPQANHSDSEFRLPQYGQGTSVPVAQPADAPVDELGRLLNASRRLCIVEDAGAGKSVFTRRVLGFASSSAGQQALFGGRPGLVQRYEQWVNEAENWPDDLQQALEAVVEPVLREIDPRLQPKDLVKWALDQGRVLILLDALDQVQNVQVLNSISNFITSKHAKHCRIVMTGRPTQVTNKRGNLLRGTDWRFARIEGFNNDQIRQYLQPHDVAQLLSNTTAVQQLISIPTVLRLLLDHLEAGGRLQQFQSLGELYDLVCPQLIRNAAKKVYPAFDNRDARRVGQIMAAVAFAMMSQGHHNAAVSGTKRVEPVEALAARICQRGISDEEWKQVQNISLSNRSILHGVNTEELAWQHRGMMEYYCGRFLAQECSDDQSRSQAMQHTNDVEWHRAWCFAIETEVDDGEHRSSVLSLLFQQPAEGRRPTELMFRSWPLLQATQQGQRTLQHFLDLYPTRQEHSVALQEMESSFVLCPPSGVAGSFQMGQGASTQWVEAVQPFLMLRAPVTVEQFQQFDAGYLVAEKGNLKRYAPEPACPAIKINWFDAWCFARWTGSRLPREYEWEFACRAGTTTNYWWGNKMDQGKCVFWQQQTQPATGRHQNEWGLQEMSGNVWEWCEDWFDMDLKKTKDQTGGVSSRVLRGGSFNFNIPDFLRSAIRNFSSPGDRNYFIGFRLSRTK